MVGDLDDHKISSSMQNFSSVQNFRYLGGLEASNSLTGTEGRTFCVLFRVASQQKKQKRTNHLVLTSKQLCLIEIVILYFIGLIDYLPEI